MPIRSAFFDSQAGDRIYTSADFARVFHRFVRDGYLPGEGGGLKVTPTTPESMAVSVGTGVAFVQGYFFEVYDQAETLSLAASNPTNPRIDRIVVRLDLLNRHVTLAVKQGTPATSPAPPDLQRDSSIWELSLARVYVAAGVAAIYSDDITDERHDRNVCGWAIPPAPTAGAESLVSAYLSANQAVPASTWTKVLFNGVERDNLGEFDPSTGRFTSRQGGVYVVSVGVYWVNDAINKWTSIALYRNGAQYRRLAALAENTTVTNMDTGTTVVSLNPGDRLDIYAFSDQAATISGGTGLTQSWLTIARIIPA